MAVCPACETEFEKRAKGGVCPSCDVALVLEKKKEQGVWVNRYNLANPVTTTPDPLQKTFDIEQTEDGWIVTYNGFFPGGNLICPECKVGFAAILSFRGSFPRQCPECNTQTTYVFNLT